MRAIVLRILLGLGIFGASLFGASLLVDWLGAGDRDVTLPPGERDGLTRVPVVQPVAVGDDPAVAGDGLSPVAGAGYTGGGATPSDGTTPSDGPGGRRDVGDTSLSVGPDDLAEMGGPSVDSGEDETVGRHFEDPCAGPAPGEPPPEEAGCDEGEPGTILAIVEPPPAAVLITPYPGETRVPWASRCVDTAYGPGEAAVVVSTSTPGDWTLEWWPRDAPDDRRRIEVHSSDPASPEHERFVAWLEGWDGVGRDLETFVQHCVVIDGIEGPGRVFELRAEGTDIFDRSAVALPAFVVVPEDRVPDEERPRPPVRVQPLDPTLIRVSVPHREDQDALARPVPLEEGEAGAAACQRVEALDRGSGAFDREFWSRGTFGRGFPAPSFNILESSWPLSDEVVSRPDYPYDPAYRQYYEAGLALDEGTRYAICVWWQHKPSASFEGSGVEEREVRLLSTPDAPRVRISLHEFDVERPVRPSEVGVTCFSAGRGRDVPDDEAGLLREGSVWTPEPSLVLCDSHGDTGSIPDSVTLRVIHRPSGGELTTRIRLQPCGLPSSSGVGIEGAAVRVCEPAGTTEFYRVVVPSDVPSRTVCGEGLFSDCEVRRLGTALIRVEYYDEGPAGGAEFEVGEPEEYDVEPGPADPPPAYPQVDTWTTRVDPGDEPGTVVVGYRVDRPVTGEIRARIHPSREPCALENPTPVTPLPAGTDRGEVTISGLCALWHYHFDLDLTDAAGNRAVYSPWAAPPFGMPSQLAELTPGHRVSVRATFNVESFSLRDDQPAVVLSRQVDFGGLGAESAFDTNLSFDTIFATTGSCARGSARVLNPYQFSGAGSFILPDLSHLQIALLARDFGILPGNVCGYRDDDLVFRHVEDIGVDDLLAGPRTIILEAGEPALARTRITVTIRTTRSP